MMHLLSPRPRKPFAGIALAAVAGIALAESAGWGAAPAAAVAGLPAVLAWVRPRLWSCLLFVAAAFFALHSARHVDSLLLGIEARLADGPQPVEVEGVVWSEPAEGKDFRGQPTAKFRVRIELLRIAGEPVHGVRFCELRWSGKAPEYGDAVRVLGSARAIEAPRNPGEFDTAGWLRRKGVAFEVHTRAAADCVVTGVGRGSWLMMHAISARQWIQAQLRTGLEDEPEVVTLIASMVLGLRGETPPEMKELFQETGTLHLFAVSGLNVAMLASIAWGLLRPLQFSRRAAALVILPLLAAYAVVTGLSPSCVRASVMAAFVLAAQFFERPAVPLNSLAAAAVAILAWDTNELFSPGFQLSFVLVLVIMSLTGPLSRRLEPAGRPDDFIPEPLWTRRQRAGFAIWRVLCQAAAVTIAAWLGSFFFMAGYFHLVSPVAIFANAVAVPLAFAVLALGLMSVIAAAFSSAIVALVNQANWLAAKSLLGSLALFARVPGGHVYVEAPRFTRGPECEIASLAVGEGAALHVRTGGGDWLLDCGDARNYDGTLLPYLRSRGVNRLDGLVLSHGDADHIGAALPLLRDFAPKWIADTTFLDRSPRRREIHAGLAATNFGRRYLRRGDEIPLGKKARLRVLFPPESLARTVADDKALACRIDAAGARVLFVSDAGFPTERWLVENEPDLRADVLVMGWHSRDLSGTGDFLLKVRPAVIVRSPPPFAMSHGQIEEWERTVEALGAVLFDQQRCGAVTITLGRGGEVGLRAFRGGQTFRSLAR